MHNVDVAESILALVTTRDRAVSTVGDLTEGAATRGVLWFWSAVFRTVASLLWRDIADEPTRVTVLAFLGLAVYIGIDVVFAGLNGFAFYEAARVSGHPLQLDSLAWKLWFTAPMLLSSLVVGRMLARWAPGRELSACVAYALVASIYNLVPVLGDNGAFAAVLCILIVPAGAAWGRDRRLRVGNEPRP